MRLNTLKIIEETEKLGWSRYRLAKEMGMANQTVYKILVSDARKENVSYTFKTVEKFAKTLLIDPKDLII